MKKWSILLALCMILALSSASTVSAGSPNADAKAAKFFIVKTYQYAMAKNAKRLCASFARSFLLANYDSRKECVRYTKKLWQGTPPPSAYRILDTVVFRGSIRVMITVTDKDPKTGRWSTWAYFLIREKGSFKLFEQIQVLPTK